MFGIFKKKQEDVFEQLDTNNLPVHIGIIMDGNGRWAKKRGLPRSAGHTMGAKVLEQITRDAGHLGIKYLTVYAFSTENWSRPAEEVKALMKLMVEYLDDYRRLIGDEDICVRIIGSKEGLSEEILEKIKIVEDATKNNSAITLNIALNYGGRDEIVKSVKKIAEGVKDGSISVDEIDEKMISDNLYTNYMPDPDFIIRPSGEQRLSNFLLWQSAYSEFWYSDINWPDFTKKDLIRAIVDYQKRNRRFGGV
ncbi:MAG: isoprenyl transferase [Ruminococcaceae bacterium]|nr:isoprenyl transferase [Oscillospiraceae bacterium]